MKIANELGFVWTDEGSGFKFLLGSKWTVKLRDIVRKVLLDQTQYPLDWLAVCEYAEHYAKTDGKICGLDDVEALTTSPPGETLVRAIWLFTRKVWNGSTSQYCESTWEVRGLADLRDYPGVPF